MHLSRGLSAIAFLAPIVLVAGCSISPPPPPVLAPPTNFIPLGLGAPYLSSDLIGGRKSRATKMRAAKIRVLSPSEAPAYMAQLERELRRQTAGIGLDVLRVGEGIVIRIPAALTFAAGSTAIKPQFDATLLEVSRTVKTQNRTYVDVFAHTDTSGTPQVNQAVSDKRAAAVAAYLGSHGVARARIASKGFGETATLYSPDVTETQKAANRRVEIRLLPYRT